MSSPAVRIIIEDTHQDWIRVYALDGNWRSDDLFEGHPGDLELDVFLRKLGFSEVEIRDA